MTQQERDMELIKILRAAIGDAYLRALNLKGRDADKIREILEDADAAIMDWEESE